MTKGKESPIRELFHSRSHGKWHLCGIIASISGVMLARSQEFSLSEEETSDLKCTLNILKSTAGKWNTQTEKLKDSL